MILLKPTGLLYFHKHVLSVYLKFETEYFLNHFKTTLPIPGFELTYRDSRFAMRFRGSAI